MMSARALFALAAALLVSACGLQPLYSGGGSGPVATTLSRIEVAPIEGKAGWLVANALRDRLMRSSEPPLYRVEIKLDDQVTALGVRRDDTVTRERRVVRARYQLIELGRGTVVLDGTAGSDVGLDVVGSDYATLAAENTALERLAPIVADEIVARLARYGMKNHNGAAGSSEQGTPATQP